MKRKVSIQKGFVYGVTAIAVLAVAVGLVVRMSTISADTAADSNADGVSECYRNYSSWWNSSQCYEKMAAACTRTEKLATKTETTPTAQEIQTYGDKVKAWDIGVNNGNPNKKWRLTMSARRTSSAGPVRFDVSITPKLQSTGGNNDRIYLIFGDGLGYKKVYNYIAKGTTWTTYINKEISVGNVNVMFVGKHEDGCLKNVLNIPQALATPTPSPSPSPSPSVSPSPTPTPDPNLVNGLKGCYYNGKAFNTLQANRNEDVNFNWGSGPATTKTNSDNFSTRWEGYVIPRFTEAYTFKLNYDDGARLWIGGKQYINDWNNGTTRTKEARVTMSAGVAVPIKIEYFDNTGDAEIQLSWSSSRQTETTIPAKYLRHQKDYTCAPGVTSVTPSPSPSVAVSAESSITSVPLSATLQAAASSDGKGVTFTATANPAVTGTVPKTNYTIWWNCSSSKTTYSALITECGTPEIIGQSPTTVMKQAGRRFVNIQSDTKTMTRNFGTTVTNNKALLLIERGGKAAVAKTTYNFVPASASQTSVVSVVPSSTSTVSRTPVPAISVNPVTSIDTKKLRDGVKADFFSGIGLQDENLIATRLVKSINYNWKENAPLAGVPKDNFSTRYTTKLLAPATGDYSIGVQYNDGIRVWLGGKLIIDKWKDFDATKCTAENTKCVTSIQMNKTAAKVAMEDGKYYDLKIEQYDKSGSAGIKFYWKRPASTSGEIVNESVFNTTYNPNPAYGSGTGLMGTYYEGTDFAKALFNRKDRTINFNWEDGGPTTSLTNNFSVRWTGQIQPRFSEKYTFQVTAADGVRLWIDDELVIDKWVDASAMTAYTAQVDLQAGKKYNIKLETYEKTGVAGIYLKWSSASEKLAFVPVGALYPGEATDISATPTVTTSASVTPSVSPSVTDEVTKTFEPGFTGIYVPEAELPQYTSALSDRGLSMYQFGPLVYDSSTPPQKTWQTAISKFQHKIGYYVKNPGSSAVTVTLKTDSSAEEASDMMVYKGWNLLANSSATAKKLSDLTYDKKICTGDGEVNCDGYSATVNFGNLTYGWKGQGKAAYTIIYVLNDPRATDQTEEPFTILNVQDKGIGNVEIPAGKLFWIYLFD